MAGEVVTVLQNLGRRIFAMASLRTTSEHMPLCQYPLLFRRLNPKYRQLCQRLGRTPS